MKKIMFVLVAALACVVTACSEDAKIWEKQKKSLHYLRKNT